MGRPRRVESDRHGPLQADLDALNAPQRGWYRTCLNRGDTPAVALEKARAYVDARERMRAIDGAHWSPHMPEYARRANEQAARRG